MKLEKILKNVMISAGLAGASFASGCVEETLQIRTNEYVGPPSINISTSSEGSEVYIVVGGAEVLIRNY